MHAEPPLQADDSAFGRLEQPDYEYDREREDDRHKCADRQFRALGQGDDQRRHHMPGHQNRDVSREVVSPLMRPILPAMGTLSDQFEKAQE